VGHILWISASESESCFQVLFRDYGLYDMAQLKMAEPKGHKISDNFYVRGDGTRAYYFSEEEVIKVRTCMYSSCLRDVNIVRAQ
jgi:hypothetical protein